jgi:phosphoenolpyruvate-protein phosphotransferase
VLVAPDLDPSAVATLRPELVAGIALSGGAPTGHAAIVARALGIPLVLGLGPALDAFRSSDRARDGAVDGSVGRLIIDPTPDEVAEFARSMAAAQAAHAPTADPGRGDGRGAMPSAIGGVTVVANIASALEAEAAVRAGAAGVGLVRTELAFLGRSTPPSVAEQRTTYARILDAMKDRPVVFRTLDVGGDKPAEWRSAVVEANPALGVRGLRLGLRLPDLLDEQFQALLEAAAGRELRVMLPMVSTVDEFDIARERLDRVRDGLVADGRDVPSIIRLGVMIEVPSAAIMADALAVSADFFSIGTNDLVQYVLAADRTSADLADLASALQPAVLRLIDGVVRAADTHGRHVAVCGEAAADPQVIPILVGLGVTELSVGPASVASVRAVLDGLDVEACRQIATRAVGARTLAEVLTLVADRAAVDEAAGRVAAPTAVDHPA